MGKILWYNYCTLQQICYSFFFGFQCTRSNCNKFVQTRKRRKREKAIAHLMNYIEKDRHWPFDMGTWMFWTHKSLQWFRNPVTFFLGVFVCMRLKLWYNRKTKNKKITCEKKWTINDEWNMKYFLVNQRLVLDGLPEKKYEPCIFKFDRMTYHLYVNCAISINRTNRSETIDKGKEV